jgi:hypothetical protein
MPGALSPSTQDSQTRAFIQHRIAGLGMVLALIGGAFVVMRVVAILSVRSPERLWGTSMLVHYAAVVVSVAMWLVGRRGERSATTMYVIELVGLASTCALYAVMAAGIPQAFRPEMTILLAFGLFLIAHAIRVPSSAKWTTLLGVVLALPLFVGSYQILTPLDPRIVAASAEAPGSVQRTPESIIAIGLANVVTWWAIIVTAAASVSAVIFGLRREVREALQLGQYTLEEKLGEGGMGIVYRARHAMLRRPTAIKLLLPEKIGEEALARFEREVQATAELAHPNTVTIYDFGRTADGLFYYAMELLDGASLEEVVRLSGPLPPGRVCRMMEQIAGALAEAHQHGLLHRDIKPANVMLTNRGGIFDVAKVVDFGLVKKLRGSKDDHSVTVENAIVGTPLYLAPEVIRGDDEDSAGRDLYALGCVGYFLLTGEPVFTGETTLHVCAQHLDEVPIPPSERLGSPLPEDMEKLIEELLAKQVSDRPPSALAVRQRLERLACHATWTQADAEKWWDEWGERLRAVRREARDASNTEGPLTVDLARRRRTSHHPRPRLGRRAAG